jgi:hypothetical protein
MLTIVFLSFGSLLWAQKNLSSEFEKKLASRVHEILFKTDPCNVQIFTTGDDSINICKRMRAGIISKANNYIGVSYRYGQSSEKGFDCSGFVKYVFRDFGLELPHSSYSQYKLSKHIETTRAQSGDLVFFITRGKGVSHVGIYLGNNQFIHSPGRGRKVSIDSLTAGYYKSHLVGFGSVL